MGFFFYKFTLINDKFSHNLLKSQLTSNTNQMKKFLIVFLIVIFPFASLIAQPAAGTEIDFSVISDVLSTLDQATGWSLQDNGKWASQRNKIPASNFKTIKRPTPREKLGVENFDQLQLKKILIDETQYNVLIIIYEDGDYEFPILQDGWRKFKSVEYFVFKAENLVKVLPRDIPFNTPYAVDMEVFCAGRIPNYDPEILDNNIVGKIQATQRQTNYNSANLVFAVRPVQEKGKEVVQFKMIRSFSKNSLTEWYLDPTSAPDLFDVSYYEAKFYQFKQFIRDSEIYNIPTKTVVNPNDYTGNYSWGVIKYQAGDYEGAIEDFNNAINTESDTTFSMIYSYRGIAKTKIGEFSGAIEDFDKAIDLQPTNVMHYANWVKNYYNRGVARFYINDLDGACADWEKSFDLGYGAALESLGKYCK